MNDITTRKLAEDYYTLYADTNVMVASQWLWDKIGGDEQAIKEFKRIQPKVAAKFGFGWRR